MASAAASDSNKANENHPSMSSPASASAAASTVASSSSSAAAKILWDMDGPDVDTWVRSVPGFLQATAKKATEAAGPADAGPVEAIQGACEGAKDGGVRCVSCPLGLIVSRTAITPTRWLGGLLFDVPSQQSPPRRTRRLTRSVRFNGTSPTKPGSIFKVPWNGCPKRNYPTPAATMERWT